MKKRQPHTQPWNQQKTKEWKSSAWELGMLFNIEYLSVMMRFNWKTLECVCVCAFGKRKTASNYTWKRKERKRNEIIAETNCEVFFSRTCVWVVKELIDGFFTHSLHPNCAKWIKTCWCKIEFWLDIGKPEMEKDWHTHQTHIRSNSNSFANSSSR